MHGKINDLFPQKITRRKKERKKARKTKTKTKTDLVSKQYINVCKLGAH
jgi:hypothetical protein